MGVYAQSCFPVLLFGKYTCSHLGLKTYMADPGGHMQLAVAWAWFMIVLGMNQRKIALFGLIYFEG